MVRSHRVVGVSLAVLALVGCSSDDPEPTPSPTASRSPSPVSSTPAPSPSPPPTTPGATVPAGFSLADVTSPTFPDLGGDLGATGVVRVGRHTGYDRVVWEFKGPGAPTYRVQYVDVPTGDASGDPVAVEGDAFIEVLVTSVTMTDAGASRPTDPSAASLAGTVVAEAKPITGGFEGYGQTFIGVRDRQRPFKVMALSGPTRLVVDIASG